MLLIHINSHISFYLYKCIFPFRVLIFYANCMVCLLYQWVSDYEEQFINIHETNFLNDLKKCAQDVEYLPILIYDFSNQLF